MNGPAVVAERLSKRYGQKCSLHDCSLTIPAGRLCALVGPNGRRQVDSPPADGRAHQTVRRPGRGARVAPGPRAAVAGPDRVPGPGAPSVQTAHG